MLAGLDSFLVLLRDRPGALFAFLAAGNLLSVFDALLTLRLLPLGFVEANPVMRALIYAHPMQATLVKVLMIAAASVAIWVLRRHKLAVQAAVFLVAVYGIVVVYELAGLLLVARPAG